jgi:molecular chaperone GrpE
MKHDQKEGELHNDSTSEQSQQAQPETPNMTESNGPVASSEPAAKEEEEIITVSIEDHTKLQSAFEEVQKKGGEYLEGWQRERAEFSNYRRRIEGEKSQLRQSLAGEILKKYLAVSDDLERALKTCPKDGEGTQWAEGVELIFRKLQSILEAEGVKRMDSDLKEFDPTRHEAISYEDHPELSSGEIIEVLQTGYMLGERVLRPALVRVAR